MSGEVRPAHLDSEILENFFEVLARLGGVFQPTH